MIRTCLVMSRAARRSRAPRVGVSTLVAADVTGEVLSSSTSAIFAALATVAAGIQASGTLRDRAKHHYERVDAYRTVRIKVRNLRAHVQSRAMTVGDGFERLDTLVDEARKRPAMP
jgi:hypothetical protein